MKRPSPYVPLAVTFATGKTGTMLLTEFGAEGLGVWAAMLAAAKLEEGLIIFKHDNDWSAIGLALQPPQLELKKLLRRLGQLKQTKTTRHGQLLYVELTRWEDWNKAKERVDSSWRKSRSRAQSKCDTDRDIGVTPTGTEAGQQPGQERDSRAREELDLELEEPYVRSSRSKTTWEDPTETEHDDAQAHERDLVRFSDDAGLEPLADVKLDWRGL